MSIVRGCGVLAILLGLGCGRVAPGTSTNKRPAMTAPNTSGTAPATGGAGPSEPYKPKSRCTPTEQGKYGSGVCGGS